MPPSILRPPLASQAPCWPYRLRQQSPQANGLVAWWTCANGLGRLQDLGFYTQDAEFNGSNYFWDNFPEGQPCFNLGASAAYAEAANTAQLSTWSGGAMTVSAWVNVTTLPSGGQNRAPVIAKGNGTGVGQAYEYSLYINGTSPAEGNSNSFTFVLWTQNGSIYQRADASASAIAAGTTYHLAATSDTSSPSLTPTLYLDGQSTGSGTTGSGTQTAGNSPVDIGRRPDGAAAQNLIAQVRDIRIYNRQLSAAEVWELYDPKTRWNLYESAWDVGLLSPVAVSAGGQVRRPLIFVPRTPFSFLE